MRLHYGMWLPKRRWHACLCGGEHSRHKTAPCQTLRTENWWSQLLVRFRSLFDDKNSRNHLIEVQSLRDVLFLDKRRFLPAMLHTDIRSGDVHQNPDIQVSRYLDIQISRYPDIHISRYPDIQISRYQISRCPDVRISSYQVSDSTYQVSDIRKICGNPQEYVFPKVKIKFGRTICCDYQLFGLLFKCCLHEIPCRLGRASEPIWRRLMCSPGPNTCKATPPILFWGNILLCVSAASHPSLPEAG